MGTVYKKELSSFFKSFSGYLFMAIVIFGVGLMEVLQFEGYGANFGYTLMMAAPLFVLAAPVLSARSFAAERALHTDQLLYSLPVKPAGLIAGKFWAMVTMLCLPTALIGVYPILLRLMAKGQTVSFSRAYFSLAAFFLLGVLWLSVGLFFSAAAKSKGGAFVLTFLVSGVLYALPRIADVLPADSAQASQIALSVLAVLFAVVVYLVTRGGVATWILFLLAELPIIILSFVKSELFVGLFAKVADVLSPFAMMENFSKGVLDLRVLVLYLSVTVLFLALTGWAVNKNKNETRV